MSIHHAKSCKSNVMNPSDCAELFAECHQTSPWQQESHVWKARGSQLGQSRDQSSWVSQVETQEWGWQLSRVIPKARTAHRVCRQIQIRPHNLLVPNNASTVWANPRSVPVGYQLSWMIPKAMIGLQSSCQISQMAAQWYGLFMPNGASTVLQTLGLF